MLLIWSCICSLIMMVPLVFLKTVDEIQFRRQSLTYCIAIISKVG